MKTSEPILKSVKGILRYKDLRGIILEEELEENDTIILNSKNFDEVVLDFRDFYKVSMLFPHVLLGVFIEEASDIPVPAYKIIILKENSNDSDKGDKAYKSTQDIVFQCMWCGNIVSDNGKVLVGRKREKAINYISTTDKPNVLKRNGSCCART